MIDDALHSYTIRILALELARSIDSTYISARRQACSMHTSMLLRAIDTRRGFVAYTWYSIIDL